jgi:hypothetical protein
VRFEQLMEMKLSKLLYIIILWSCFGDLIAVSPCDYEVKYKVRHTGTEGYQISLRATGNGALFKITLYDLYSGVTVEEKQVQLGSNDEKVAFERVKPSHYLIYISSEFCPKQRSLGGIEGIKVGN